MHSLRVDDLHVCCNYHACLMYIVRRVRVLAFLSIYLIVWMVIPVMLLCCDLSVDPDNSLTTLS